jgi:hypothetical protein
LVERALRLAAELALHRWDERPAPNGVRIGWVLHDAVVNLRLLRDDATLEEWCDFARGLLDELIYGLPVLAEAWSDDGE